MRLIDANALKAKAVTLKPFEYRQRLMVVVETHDIDHAPTVDPVKHGWWRYFGDETIEDGGYCSVCLREQPMFWVKKTWRYVETRYCPHCGALMDEEG